MFDSIFAVSSPDKVVLKVILAFFVSLILGVLISLVNYKTLKNKSALNKMSQTLVVLPLLVAVIIYLVGTNVASALSLGGAFAIIRFRSQAEPKDISYVLASMGCGLACGLGYLAYSVIIALIFCIVMIVLSLIKYGEETYKLLKIRVPEALNNMEAFNEIIVKYVTFYKLSRMKTADLGSVYELHYIIKQKKEINPKEFIDELRCRNGNLTISILDYEVTVSE